MKKSKIKGSDRIVAEIIGPRLVTSFSIEARRALSGVPTFTLVYHHGWGTHVELVVDQPLATIKYELRRFAAANSLAIFGPAVHLAEALSSPQLFDPPQMNTGGWEWCLKCRGLRKGRVVESEGGYVLSPEGHGQYGVVTALCACPGGHEGVEVVLGRFFYSPDTHGGHPYRHKDLVLRDDGKMAEGDVIRYYERNVRIQVLGFFATFAEAVEAVPEVPAAE